MNIINHNVLTGVVTQQDDLFQLENLSTKIVIDFTDTDYEDWDKQLVVEVGNSNVGVGPIDLGLNPIVEYTLIDDLLVADYIKFQPSVVGEGGVIKKFAVKNAPVKKSLLTTPLTPTENNTLATLQLRVTNLELEVDTKVDKVAGKSLVADTEITKLAGVEAGANNYAHPSTHSADILVDGTTNKVFSATDKNKLDGIATGAEVNAVDSVAGRTGDVVLAKGDVGLGNVDNTSDANKPVSTAQATALGEKVDKVAGKSLVDDTAIVDLTDGLNTTLHAHNVIKNEVAESNGKVEALDVGVKVTRNINDANTAFVINKQLGTGNIADFRFGDVIKAYIDYLGNIVGAYTYVSAIINKGTGSNGRIDMLDAGTKISRNIADANPALIIDQANVGATGDIQQWKFGGAYKAGITPGGNFFAAGLASTNGSSKGFLTLPDTGPVISRNIADANPALIVDLVNASSTGEILQVKKAGVVYGGFDAVGTPYGGIEQTVTDKNKYLPLLKDSAGNMVFKKQTAIWNGSAFDTSEAESYFVGRNAGSSNTGKNVTIFGRGAGNTNTGNNVSMFGHFAGQNNKAGQAILCGYYAGSENIGSDATLVGYQSGQYNIGSVPIFYGVNSGQYNVAQYDIGIGNSALRYNQKNNNTVVGGDAYGSVFLENTAGNKTVNFTAVDITLDRVTLAAHGFGSTNAYVNIKYASTTGTAIGGLSVGSIYQIKIIDANTIEFRTAGRGTDLTSQGTGDHTFTPQFAYSNVSCFGYGSTPTKDNQVVLGNGSVAEVYSAGDFVTPLAAVNKVGGHMVRLVNKTGATSVKGTLVSASTTTDSAFQLQNNEFDTIGIVYESGIADGALCWIVVTGIAEVLLKDGTASTRGYWAIGADTDGRANITQPTPTPNNTLNEHTTHFKEIGHCIESKTAGTNVLAKCIIHFN